MTVYRASGPDERRRRRRAALRQWRSAALRGVGLTAVIWLLTMTAVGGVSPYTSIAALMIDSTPGFLGGSILAAVFTLAVTLWRTR